MEDYLTKLDKMFAPDKFLKKNPIQKYDNYRKLIETFLTEGDKLLLKPCENLKKWL